MPLSIALYEAGAAHAHERGIILADTKFEFGRRAGRHDRPRRRSAHARLVAVLAGGRLRARSRAAELRQAVRARLGVGPGWDRTPSAPELPPEVVEGTRARYAEAYERITGEPFATWLEASRRDPSSGLQADSMRARVLIRPKKGILDPRSQAVERALPALGFEGVANVHVGRLIELDVEDGSQVPAMCERLLANPLIEDYEVIEVPT